MARANEWKGRRRKVFLKNLQTDAPLTDQRVVEARQLKMIALPGHKDVAGAVIRDRCSHMLHAFRHSHQHIARAHVEPFAHESAASSRPYKNNRAVQIA